MTSIRQDKELEQFRNLMQVPSTFEDGFSWTALVGALFVAMIMVPGAIYMGLLAGIGIGPAAKWVTVILFIEVARRAHRHIRRAELFVLFYMAGAAMMQPFQGLLWNQFFVQSRAAVGMGIAEYMSEVPWFAPTDPEVLAQRNFLHPAWYFALGMVLFQTLMGRFKGAILSYGLFRVASDIEKLPFPMAPIGAQGIMALAEQQTEEAGEAESEDEAGNWRWRVFSVGGVLGLGFGSLYTALPAVSSALLGKPITIFPIPFVDWSDKTAEYLPAFASGLSFDMGQLVLGMVLPFFAMLGSFIGLLFTMIANPILYNYDVLRTWESGQSTVKTLFSNNVDFYFSFTIGVSLAIAIAGFWQVYRGIKAKKKERERQRAERLEADEHLGTEIPEGRGDIPVSVIIAVYLFTSILYVLLSGWLIDWHPGVMWVLVFFAFVYTPLISYVTARMEGIAGQVVEIPFIREAAFLLSGYSGGVKVWFLPIPKANYGQRTVFYRQAELTGTRFWSVWKAELVLVPIVIIASMIFAQFIWSLGPVPSAEYPYAQMMWEFNAANQSIVLTATLGRFSTFQKALNVWYIGAGTAFGVVLFALLWALKLPIFLVYGTVRGLNQTMPHVVVPQFIGAMIGRFYFQRKMGLKWRQYIPVVAAGFSCGVGLVTVLGVGANFLAKAVIKIPF